MERGEGGIGFRIAEGEHFELRISDCGKSEGWSQELNAKGQKQTKTLNEKLGLRFRSTWDIIRAAEEGKLPDKMMITVHPQRWHDKPLPWVQELVWQNTKNLVKRMIVSKQ